MTNNKSKHLARMAGGHKVFLPESEKKYQVSDDELQRRRDFVTRASGSKSMNVIINTFSEFLLTFESNPQVVDQVSRRTGLSKRETVNSLVFFKNEYGTRLEIRRLMFKEW
jgi:hypothetical protein